MVKKRADLLRSLVSPIIPRFTQKDMLQVVIGASILAVPVGFTQETWDLGGVLPLRNILGLLALTVIFISMFTHYQYHHRAQVKMRGEFLKRVFFTYAFSFLIVALILSLIHQGFFSPDVSHLLAFKRTVIVTFPCSLSASLADTLH
jgi:uncharacterized membrane protein